MMEENNIKECKAPIIYTNYVSLEMGVYDLSLNLGIRYDQKIIENAKVIMSWQHAKKLTELLNQQIEFYENLYGKINTTDLDKEKMDKLVSEGKINVQSLGQ